MCPGSRLPATHDQLACSVCEPGCVVSLLLSVTFACGLVIAVAHVINRGFIAPVYDVVANLTAFASAAAASVLLEHWTPAVLSAFAFVCWLWLARRTLLALRSRSVRPEPETART